MNERHVSQLIQNLVERFEYLGEHKFNLDQELGFLTDPVTREPLDKEIVRLIEHGFLEKRDYKRSHDGATIVPVSIVSDPRDHEEWYDQWLEENNNESGSYYWRRLEDFLSRELTSKYGPERAGKVVRTIDEATFSIIKKLANPKRREFSYKGLVVGYVQSGKTANFTALISKAADAGYKLIIVLSGIHSVLRRQTQMRLDKELTGMNDIGTGEAFIPEPSDMKRWNRITTARLKTSRSRDGLSKIKDLGEFDTINVDPFDSICNRATPTLAIIKKNVKVLDKLIGYIKHSSAENRRNIPVLIIDDEADQASVDGNANNQDADPTSINLRIRTILSMFPRRAYIGYTATPFANVLIDMTAEHPLLQDDLYPRNFIVSLPRPENYFGASLIFQSDLSDKFIIEIPTELNNARYDEAATLLQTGEITECLAKAIDNFIIGCAIRNLRNDKAKPMSMLVHVTHKIDDMKVIYDIIIEYIAVISKRYANKTQAVLLRKEFETVWDEFVADAASINEGLKLENAIPAFREVWKEIANVFKVLSVLELNSSSDTRLDYTSGEEIKIVAIGGNQLSRGLTLEGLMISYYLRVNSNMAYDTLLQMGRWFGYRQKYEDLTRIHTTRQVWDYFEHLALVEEELRSEIYRYEEENMTPLQMAVAIRDHRNLNVTAPNKMGAARVRYLSYSESLNQTTWLPLDQPNILKANYKLGESFIRKIAANNQFIHKDGIHLAKNKVDGRTVLKEFLERYTFVDKLSTGGPGLDAQSMLEYITQRQSGPNPELMQWSVAVIGNINENPENRSVNYGGLPLNLIQRSRKYTERGYNVGILTDPAHMDIDLTDDETRSSQNPLLLLYLIGKESKAGTQLDKPSPGQRINLFRFIKTEKMDALGLAIIFPKSQYQPDNYIGQ
jgi:hypothetical protein